MLTIPQATRAWSSPSAKEGIAIRGEELRLTSGDVQFTVARALALGAVVLAMLAPGAGAAAPFQPGAIGFAHRPVCGAVPLRVARCHSEVVVDATGAPLVTTGPAG